jgi:ribosomal protein L29
MAIIKTKEIKSLPKEELLSKLNDLRKELMKLNAQVARHTNPKSPSILRGTKKAIAKITFLLNQKEKAKKPKEVKQKHE